MLELQSEAGLSGKRVRLTEVWCTRCYEGHTDEINSVAVSPDGRWALSAGKDKTLRQWEFVWDYEFPERAEFHENVRPYLEIFLKLHCSYDDDGISRIGKPSWNKNDFKKLLKELKFRGFGWLQPEDIHKELEEMTKHLKNHGYQSFLEGNRYEMAERKW